LVLPMFVADGIDEPRPIASMPGVVQHTRSTLREAAADAVWRHIMDAGEYLKELIQSRRQHRSA